MTEHDKKNVEDILSGTGTWFTANLFRLISTSDIDHRASLALAFPDEVNVVHKFQTGKDFKPSEQWLVARTKKLLADQKGFTSEPIE